MVICHHSRGKLIPSVANNEEFTYPIWPVCKSLQRILRATFCQIKPLFFWTLGKNPSSKPMMMVGAQVPYLSTASVLRAACISQLLQFSELIPVNRCHVLFIYIFLRGFASYAGSLNGLDGQWVHRKWAV
jgi:hypothetical protein